MHETTTAAIVASALSIDREFSARARYQLCKVSHDVEYQSSDSFLEGNYFLVSDLFQKKNIPKPNS